MDIEIRPIVPDEFEGYLRATSVAFGWDVTDKDIENERLVFESDRSLAAFDRSDIVGGLMTSSFRLTTPGSASPAAGVTMASVIPTHRRRGLLTSLMRRHLEDVRERNEPVSILWASEGPIYGRFGYGISTWSARFSIERTHAAFLEGRGPGGRIRMVTKDGALEAFPALYDLLLPGQPGMIGRTPTWWKYWTYEPEQMRRGFSEAYFALHEGPDGPDGYVAYAVKNNWAEGVAANVLEVQELITASPDAYADLWRYCFDVDLIGTIQGHNRRPDEALVHLLAHPRHLKLQIGEGLWLRIVDVPKALTSRRYPAEGRLVIDVRDGFCPWNEGTFELAGGPDGAECRPTDGQADIVLDAAALGAAYLGGNRLSTLAAAGRVAEATPGALARADTMFASDPPPWCPEVF